MWSILLNMQESARKKTDAPPALFGVGWHGQRFMLFLWPPNGPGLFFPEPVLVLQLQFCTCLWLEEKGGTFLFFLFFFSRRNRLPSSWKGCMELILPGSLSNNRKALVPSTSLGNMLLACQLSQRGAWSNSFCHSAHLNISSSKQHFGGSVLIYFIVSCFMFY